MGAVAIDVGGLPSGYVRATPPNGDVVITGPKGGVCLSIDDLPVSTGQFSGTYSPNPKHDVDRLGVSPQPTNPESTLLNSVPLGGNSKGRIGYDSETGEIVVFRFDTASNVNAGNFHGYASTWDQISQAQKNALIQAGLFTSRGRVVK